MCWKESRWHWKEGQREDQREDSRGALRRRASDAGTGGAVNDRMSKVKVKVEGHSP